MIKHKSVKRIVATGLAVILQLNTMGFVPLDNSEEVKPEFVPGFYDIGYSAPIIEKKTTQSVFNLLTSNTLPSSYSSVEEGNVTSIKNQGSLGTCWAFAATAAMESYAISHGLVNSAENIDLSEYALAYLTFDDSSFTDTVGTTAGDMTSTNSIYDALYNGGNDNYAFKTLSKWAGIMEEEDFSYDQSVNTTVKYDASKVSYILTGQYFINMENISYVKEAIMENGAVASYYNADDEYSNSAPGYPYYYHYTYKEISSNHAVAIVGWDDTISKSNFVIMDDEGQLHTPSNDGAWLIKNSWGTYYGDEGYMWISYEDKVMSQATACVYEIAPSSTYDYNYQHDGSNIFGYSITFGATKYANVFNVSGTKTQEINAVSVAVESDNRDYSVQIYLNPDTDSPTSGTPMLSTPVTGSTTFAGYYTIPLSEKVVVEPGESFSVVIEFDQETDISSGINGSVVIGGNGVATAVNTCGNNQSYVYGGNSFIDLYDYYGSAGSGNVNLCIKAFAVDSVDNITASTITSIKQDGLTGLTVSWQKVQSGITYTLLRATSADGQYQTVYTGTALSYTDTNVAKNTDYYYKVRVYDDTTPLDSAVKNGRVELPKTVLRESNVASNGIELTWDAVNMIDGYNIYRSTDGINYSKVGSVQGATSYTDTSAEFFTNYNYYIKTYITSGNVTDESKASNVLSQSRRVTGFSAINNIFDEVELSWDNVANADGYVIYMGATDVDDNYDPKEKIAELGAGTTSYTVNVSDLKRGQDARFYIEAYKMVNGERVNCDITATYVYLLYKPVENIKWYVQNNLIYVKWDSYVSDMSVTGYNLNGYVDANTADYLTLRTTTSNSVSVPAFTLNNQYYVTVVAKNAMYNVFTFLQEPRVKVGGNFITPELKTIDDVYYNIGDSVTLTAELKGEMENFDYHYQWYKTTSPTASGTAIGGATKNTYVPDTGTDTISYYYCEVWGTYNGTIKDTSNVVMVRSNNAKENIANCSISSISSKNYTGSAITPDFTVAYNGVSLTKGTDYTVTYSNNVNVGTATITITGKGKYEGSKTISFRINAIDVSTATISAIPEYVYTGKEIKPNFTVTCNGRSLVNGTDYVVNYSNNINAGTATLTILGKGNYCGTQTRAFYIVKNIPASITSSVVNVNQSSGVVSKVTVGTTVLGLLNAIDQKEYVAVYNGGTLLSKDAVLATGMQIKIIDGSTSYKQYTIVVTGDTNGDGKINVADMMSVKSHILKKSTLTGTAFKAADVNGDGKINVADFMSIKGYILKKNTIAGVVSK